MEWNNTNKLLNKGMGFEGTKTGITRSAGPCLSSYLYKYDNPYVIIVLRCAELVDRFNDTIKLSRLIKE